MSTTSNISTPTWRPGPTWLLPVVAFAAVGWFLVVQGPKSGLPLAPHTPRWDLLFEQAAVLKLHVGAAIASFALGLIQLSGAKGTMMHRALGWCWALTMFTAAVSSLFIRNINSGAFSWIHILSGWTLVILPLGLYAARRHDVGAHRRHMVGLFLGALVIAGLFTFLPGRLMWRIFLG